MERKKEKIMENMAEQLVQDGVVCGVSYGFVEEGEARLHYYGRQGSILPYRERRIQKGQYYDLASLTKVTGTTTRMLQLIEKGRIGFHTPVKEILDRFQYPDITVENLLLHNSGLPAEIRNKESWNRENLLEYLYTTPPQWKAGEFFLYSDVGFILLGKIIERLDKTSLEETFKKNIFLPLQMNDTSFLLKEEKQRYIPTECTEQRGCICGEVHDTKAFMLGQCGSAGLFSTLEDMAGFVQACLNRSKLLFGNEMFEELCGRIQSGRTLGWSKEYGGDTLYHTGFTGTSVLMDMNKKRGFLLLTNRVHPNRQNDVFLKRRKEMNEVYLGSGF
ncbi:serine hydrolase domain-containing protein [Lachnospiraceae bacterium 54-53]